MAMQGMAAAAAMVAMAGVVQAQLLPPAGSPGQAEPAPVSPATPGAPATPASPLDAMAGEGRLLFFSDTADAGEIFDNAPAPLEFKFRNVGPGPLTITRVQPSCGCTVPDMEKTVFEPNEIGTISVSFDPKGGQGNMSRSIQVFTDSRSTPSQTITVKAFVKPIVLTVPGDIVNFEAIPKGQGAEREIRVFGRFPDFEVTRVSTSDPLLYEVEVEKVGEAQSMGETLYEWKIKARLKADATPGTHNSSLTIRTNDERKPIFSVALMSRVTGDLELSPVRMTLGRLSVGDTFEREIRVRSRTAEAFEITGAAMSNPSVAAEFTFEPVDPESRTEWIVRAKGVVRSAAPRFNATLNLITDVKDEELTPVQMTGVLRPS
jgi:hypothetical protein